MFVGNGGACCTVGVVYNKQYWSMDVMDFEVRISLIVETTKKSFQTISMDPSKVVYRTK